MRIISVVLVLMEKNYNNDIFHIRDRDVYHHKFLNYVDQLSMFDNHILNCNNLLSYGEYGKFANISPTVGQVETVIMYNPNTSQFQNGSQCFHVCKQYLIEFTNRQFIDHHTGTSVFLVFIQEVENRDNNGFYFFAC